MLLQNKQCAHGQDLPSRVDILFRSGMQPVAIPKQEKLGACAVQVGRRSLSHCAAGRVVNAWFAVNGVRMCNEPTLAARAPADTLKMEKEKKKKETKLSSVLEGRNRSLFISLQCDAKCWKAFRINEVTTMLIFSKSIPALKFIDVFLYLRRMQKRPTLQFAARGNFK